MQRVAVALVLLASPSFAAEPPDSLAREVYPLLQRACFECHGPQKQRGGLRLDSREALRAGGDSGPATRELLRRVKLPATAEGAMPPRGDRLTPQQVQLLQRWIEQGTPWPEEAARSRHWAYVRPQRPTPPQPRHPIDAFVRARLEKEGLLPSPEAPREVLIRRLSLDLIGLPPTPQEVEAFVRDPAPEAYERLVDRLLASPQFGVRWARPWLDAARYADSHGFQRDDLRDLWPYRDWVIAALNADMPFDQFTIEQLAGDLLPNATESQKVATGFNRSAPTNVEAGSDPEETRVNQVFDRVNTLGTVWLGTTLECAQCHDHKYDPITQKDYYRLFAIFNNTESEAERANPKVPGSIRFTGPTLELTDPTITTTRARLQASLAELDRRLAARTAELRKPDPVWEASVRAAAGEAPREHVLDVDDFDSLGGSTHQVLKDHSILLSGEVPDRDTYTVTVKTTLRGIRAFQLEALTDPSLPGKGPGRGDAARPNFVLNTFEVQATPANGGTPRPVRLVRARASFSQAKFDVAGAIDTDSRTAWAINPRFGEPHRAVFETAEPIGFPEGTILQFTLVQNFGGGRTIGRLRLAAITGSVGREAVPTAVVEALAATERTPAQRKALLDYRQSQDAESTRLLAEKRRLEAELTRAVAPTTLVMKELPQPRTTTLFRRGDFRTPGEKVEPGTPAVLPSAGPVRNRLELARWLVSRENPLTARVVVNRWWAELFGQGLVETPEDFGIKGEGPTHPELLDWLAVELMEPSRPASGGAPASPWSMKHLLRLIVTSATYRQSSRVTPELLARDDRNRLLARRPRLRLDAEQIRDNALAIAGLLSTKLGGPPVRPPQPEGLWVKVGGQRYDYTVSPGEEKYRRGVFVVWKRAAPYPSFVAFDATNRMVCRVRRPRSNTPLQALTLLNDPVYVEAALGFARRLVTEKPGASVEERIIHAFRLAVSRTPHADEVAVLKTLFESQRRGTKPDGAKQLIGSFSVPAGVSVTEFAAWYAVATAILNLDETITKG